MNAQLEKNMKVMLDNIQQLKRKKGPHYDKWLFHYRQAVEGGFCGTDSRYLQGIKRYLKEADKK